MAMNYASGNWHSEHHNGSALSSARADLVEMAIAIARAPDHLVDETVRLWAGRVGEMVECGVIEHSDGVDALRGRASRGA